MQLALAAQTDEDYWEAVNALRSRGTRDVFELARELCLREGSEFREIGAYVLGQLGGSERPFLNESTPILVRMLECEQDPDVLCAVAMSAGQIAQCVEGVVPLLTKLSHHEEARVRFG